MGVKFVSLPPWMLRISKAQKMTQRLGVDERDQVVSMGTPVGRVSCSKRT
jgi:hypothetical protein